MPPLRGFFVWWGRSYKYIAPTALGCRVRANVGGGRFPQPRQGRNICSRQSQNNVFKLRQERHLYNPAPAKPKAPDMPPLRGFFVCWDVELQIYRAYGAGMPGSRKCWAAGVSPSPGRGEIFVARNPKIIFSSSVRSGIFVTPPPAKPIAPNIPPLTGLFRLVGCGATNLSHLRRWDAAVGLSGF